MHVYLTVISSDGHMRMYTNTLTITHEKYLRPNVGVFVADVNFQLKKKKIDRKCIM